MRLTKRDVEKLVYSAENGKQQILWDKDGTGAGAPLSGFGIRVYPSGKKSYVLFYRVTGRQHIKVVGQHGPLTLEQARERAKIDVVTTMDNKDPLAEKRLAKQGITFKDFCPVYIERHAKKKKRTWQADQRRIDKYLLTTLGPLLLASIAKRDITRLYESLVCDYPYEANRMIQQLSKMFEFAKEQGFISDQTFNVTRGVKTFKEVKRDRWVTPEELPLLAKAINEEVNIYGRFGLWLYLLTGLRRGELLKIRWDDVDLQRKILTLVETKNGKTHYLPLSGPAINLFNEIPRLDGNPYVLPGKFEGQHLVNIEKIWFRVREKAGLYSEDKNKVVRLHDLRRTLGSWLAQSGNSLHLIGRVLNHSSQSTTAIYARFAQDHVRDALDKHAESLMVAAGDQAPVKSVPGKVNEAD